MKTLYVNYAGSEKRVAIEEKKKIVEFLWKRNEEQEIVGHIYVGRVVRTIAGMNAFCKHRFRKTCLPFIR